MTANLAASIHARLLNLAKERGEDFNQVLSRYATERFLYRLSSLPAREELWLKGAKLFDLWFDIPHRPTRDSDFLGFGPLDAELLRRTVADICLVRNEDGMAFDPASIVVEPIRDDAHYSGLRVRLVGALGRARTTVQLDVGYGDAVTPGPEEATYPTLLDGFPAPHLRVYPRATVVAEKLEAIVSIGMANTRLKDYYDLRALIREGQLEAAQLAQAIEATFRRRGTHMPEEQPVGLSDQFSEDVAKQAQWKAFLGRNRLEGIDLGDVVTEIRDFLDGPLELARNRLRTTGQ
jgi:predicted nucleotidyltransferase component of viral defense system